MLAAVLTVTSLVCCAVTAGATSEYDLTKELKKYSITAKTTYDSAVFGYYEKYSSRYNLCVSGLSTEGGDKIAELLKDGYELSVLLKFDTGAGFIYEGDKRIINMKRDNMAIENYPVNLELKYFKKAASVYRLALCFYLTNDISFNKDVENAILEAKGATLTIAAAPTTSEGKRTYYDKKKVFYIPFTDKTSAKKIERIDINTLEISAIRSKTYNAEYQEPDVVIKGGGVRLKKNTDYSLTYYNNVSIGTATVVIKGKGDYKGTVKKTFNIVPETTRIRSAFINGTYIDITWAPIEGIDNYHIYVSEDNGKTYKLYETVDADTTKFSLKFPLNADYTIKLCTSKTKGGKVYYSKFSDATQRFRGV